MQAIMVTFISATPVDVLRDRLERYTVGLLSVPGLVMKSWIVDDFVLGGFYLFDDQDTADGYLQREFCDTLMSDPCFSCFKINRYDVIDDLSAIAGCPETSCRREPTAPEDTARALRDVVETSRVPRWRRSRHQPPVAAR